MNRAYIWLCVFCISAGLASAANAQTNTSPQQPKPTTVDTVKSKQPAKSAQTGAKQGGSHEELVLGEINIEAVIEKPNVDIIPNRIEPDMDDVAFIDRSFEHEIKQLPKNFMLYDEELDSAQKLERLKKLVTKKK